MSSFFLTPAFSAGLLLSLSLIVAIGPQNAHVLRMGLRGQHVGLTVAVSIASDVALIALGVLGLSQLGGLPRWVQAVMVCGGVVFLLLYGWKAWGRFRAGSAAYQAVGEPVAAMSRQQAVGAALAVAWLNPHALVETLVLIGTASLAWGTPGNTFFGLGAASGSVLWFVGLGLSALLLGQRLQSPALWRALDGLVALMMWGTAGMLAYGLL